MYRFEIVQSMKYVVQAEKSNTDGVDYLTLHIESKEVKPLSQIAVKVFVPSSKVHYRWTPKIHYIKGLDFNGFQNLYRSNGYSGAPVEALISQDNRNCTTIGLSDTQIGRAHV